MEIVFADQDLETLCSDARQQQKRLGQKRARQLRARLADLVAAARVTALIAGHPHPLTGNRGGQFALRIDGLFRLVFEPAHEPIPRRDDGTVGWAEVTAVRIVFIGDYHD